jgi:hypothetical protein
MEQENHRRWITRQKEIAMASEEAVDKTPKDIIVGPYRYKIEFDRDAAWDYDFLGSCQFRSKKIKLEPQQADTNLPHTLLHEVLHALGDAFEIKEWSQHTTNEKQETTDKIDLMASALLQFIRANPDIVKWLGETK